MKRFVFLCVVAVIMLGCSDSESAAKQFKEREPFTGTIPGSMKGFELYSWEENNQWTFTLITGTNRIKTHDEITGDGNTVTDGFIKITVSGLTDAKSLLNLVPGESSVFWISDPSRVKGFSIPPFSIEEEIQSHCESLQLNLQIIK